MKHFDLAKIQGKSVYNVKMKNFKDNIYFAVDNKLFTFDPKADDIQETFCTNDDDTLIK